MWIEDVERLGGVLVFDDSAVFLFNVLRLASLKQAIVFGEMPGASCFGLSDGVPCHRF